MANNEAITNGGFGDGGSGWTNNIVNAGSGGVAFGGGAATITGPDGSAGPGFVEIFQNAANPSGAAATLSFDLVSYTSVDVGFTPAFDSGYVSVNNAASGLNADGSVSPGLIPGSGSQGGYGDLQVFPPHSNINYTLNVPAGSTNIRVGFGVDSADNLYGPGVFRLDNVSLKVPEPTTAALLALGGCALLRRRR
jgi:hypothetical protein